MKRLLSIVMGFVVALSALQAQDKVSLSSVDFVKGQSVTMTVDLQNTTVFSAFQMDLTLPEGFAIATLEGSDKLAITLSDSRKHSSHILSYNKQGSKVRITAYSGSNANFTGITGSLLTIGLVATDAAVPGVYSATLNRVLFTTADEDEIGLADALGEIKLKYDVQGSVTDASLGSISITGDSYYGSELAIAVSPIAHYELDKLLVNGVDMTSEVKNNVYTISSLASDVNAVASFKPMTYIATFVIDGQVIAEKPIVYNTSVEVPEAPFKEGHTFAGWASVPNLMPGENITINGSYTVNSYTVVFKIGDDVISTETLAYGSKIVAPEAPEKEGHTFAGWGEVAATVPASDVTYEGSYTVNTYTVTFKIGDEVIFSESMAYGTEIVAPEAPVKEGHTFAGWGEVAATVPASDVTYEGSYTVNIYMVYYYVGEELVHTAEVAYGEAIPEYVYEPTAEGYVFLGWIGETYETMPAHDVTYTANIDDGIEAVFAGELVDIYTLRGVKVHSNVRFDDVKNSLKKGMYIINGKKVAIQ